MLFEVLKTGITFGESHFNMVKKAGPLRDQVLVLLQLAKTSFARFQKTKKPSLATRLFICTLNGSILELCYQDLNKLYELKDTLINEGIIEYQGSNSNLNGNENYLRLQNRT